MVTLYRPEFDGGSFVRGAKYRRICDAILGMNVGMVVTIPASDCAMFYYVARKEGWRFSRRVFMEDCQTFYKMRLTDINYDWDKEKEKPNG